MSKTMLFRTADEPNPDLDGLAAEYIVTGDVAAALANGWHRYRDFVAASGPEPEAPAARGRKKANA